MIVVWRITQRCNLACPFCSYDRATGGVRLEAAPGTVAALGAQLAAFQRDRGESVLVSWIGGEPFLWPHLRPMTRLLTQEFGLRVSATTNGTALRSESVRDEISSYFSELTVSIDRLGTAHDTLRGWSGGFALLKDALAALAERKKRTGRGPKLRVNTVLMRDNLREFPLLCEELVSWGVEEITFNQLGGRDRPEYFPAHRLEPADIDVLEGMIPALKEQLAGRGVHLSSGSDYLHRFRASATGQRLPIRDCGAGERFLFVDEAGRVSPCNYTAHTLGVPLAEVISAGGIGQLPTRFASARETRRPAACDDCHCTQVWDKFSPASRPVLPEVPAAFDTAPATS